MATFAITPNRRLDGRMEADPTLIRGDGARTAGVIAEPCLDPGAIAGTLQSEEAEAQQRHEVAWVRLKPEARVDHHSQFFSWGDGRRPSTSQLP